MQKLTADMQTDIEFVIDAVRRATDFRTPTSRDWWFLKSRKAEWLIDGEWRAVRLNGDR